MLAIARFASAVAILLTAADPASPQETRGAGRTAAALLDQPARLQVENVLLVEALAELNRRAGVPVAFSPSLMPHRMVTCSCTSTTVEQALRQVLSGTSFGYAVIGGQIVIEESASQLGPRAAPLRLAALQAQAGALPEPADETEFTTQQTGTVTGTVLERGTMAPLPAAQISIAGSGIGSMADPRGRYLLINVPVGQQTVRAELLGYGIAEEAVTVTEGDTVVVDFDLSTRAIVLDEMVITGTAGGTQRRAIGNVVDRVSAAAALEVAPVADVQQLMGFKSPGLSVLPARGEIGTGGAIRIRGASTLGLSSEPIVYIDGVRMNSGFGGPPGDGGQNISRLNDINPEDIESFEIIKGPAAATLYGTEASAGVIQIITKRGVEGAPRFDVTVGQGATWFPNPAEALGETFGLDESGNLVSMNLYRHEEENGLGPVFQTGRLQKYTASVTGGTGRVLYFASANWDDQTGIVDYNWLKGLSTRANLSVLPRSDLTLSLNTAYMRSTTEKWQGFPDDIYRQLLWGGPSRLNSPTRGFVRRTPESLREETERFAHVNRVITGFTAEHVPTSWLTQRLKVGVDVTNEDDSRLVRRSPLGALGMFGSNSLGTRMVEERRTDVISVDYGATVSLPLGESITSASSVGAQYFRRAQNLYELEGHIFPAPGFETIGSMAVTSAGEDFFENVTVGTFVQQQFGWRDRLFVTGAVRADDNSAFGTSFDAAIYPKLSAAWVVHEEPFWNVDWVSQLRLRSAWGAAGRQPDVFDAPRLYEAVTGPSDEAGVTPSSYGNPNLKPERSEELEVGFDAGLFNDRIEFTYTHYNKKTRDAIIHVPIAPSIGFPGAQVLNLGALTNWGHEFSLTARVLDRQATALELGLQASLLRDRVDDVGPVDFIHVGDSRSATQHRVGYPSQSVFYRRVLTAELLPDGSTANEMCDGGTGTDGLQPGGQLMPCEGAPELYWGRSGNPTWEAGLWTTVTLGVLRLHARVDGRGGHMMMENDAAAAHTTFTNTSWSNLKSNAVFQAYRKIGREGLAFSDAGFLRLRDLSATVTIPPAWVRLIGGSRASLTVAGRNLALLWQEQKLVELPDGSVIPDPPVRDPERRITSEVGTFQQALVPPLASFMTTIRVSF